MQIKTTMWYHCSPIRMAKIWKSDHTMCEKDMKQLGPSHIAGGNGKQYNHFRTQFGGLLKS